MQSDEKLKYSAPAAACAADLLLALARADGPMTLAALIERTTYSRSLLYRTLKTLGTRGFVVEEAAHGISGSLHYRLGSAAAEIGGAYQSNVPFEESVRSALRALAQRTGETASVATIEGEDVLYVMREEGRYSVLAVSRVGKRLPAHATAMGKALLARFDDGEIRALYGRGELRRFTGNTITDPEVLLRNLAEARLRGYAVEHSELVQGRCCIAFTLQAGPGPGDLLGISLSTTEARFEVEHDALILAVLTTRDALLADLSRRRVPGDRTVARDLTASLGAISRRAMPTAVGT